MERTGTSVRPLEEKDIAKIVDYFLNADSDFLLKMGVDISKLPKRKEWLDLIQNNHKLSIENKKFYYIIWQLNNKPIGHSNINKIIFGQEAFMHLHLWQPNIRRSGVGLKLLKLTLPYYFKNFELQNLFCEPSALNPAPNRILEKIGFEFVKSYETIPGWINSFQTVNKWCLTKEKFDEIIR